MAAAAFYDLEGTLVSTNLVHTLGFYAKHQQGLWRTVKKRTTTLLSIPLFAVTDQYSRPTSYSRKCSSRRYFPALLN